MMEVLKEYKIECLYKKMSKKKVTEPILWKLDSKHFEYLGFNLIETLKYEEAKRKWKSDNGKSSIASFSSNFQSLSLSGNQLSKIKKIEIVDILILSKM